MVDAAERRICHQPASLLADATAEVDVFAALQRRIEACQRLEYMTADN
jgi:hypothetical protein